MDYVDTKIILRYILKDNADQSELSRQILETQSIMLTFEVLAEVSYVLLKVYRVPRKEISASLASVLVLVNIKTPDDAVMAYGIRIFSETSFDFVDCVLIGYNSIRGFTVHTFDKQMKKHLR